MLKESESMLRPLKEGAKEATENKRTKEFVLERGIGTSVATGVLPPAITTGIAKEGFQDVPGDPIRATDETRLRPIVTMQERGKSVFKGLESIYKNSPDFNYDSVFRDVFLNDEFLLTLNNNYRSTPSEDSYALFSHIYRFLTEKSTNVYNKSRFLLQIKTNAETINSMNNEQLVTDNVKEKRDFNEKLVMQFNKMQAFDWKQEVPEYNNINFDYDVDAAHNTLFDNFKPKVNEEGNEVKTTGCNYQESNIKREKTYYNLFNEGTNFENVIQIVPEITNAVQRYDLDKFTTPISEVPIYFIVKTDSNKVTAHLTLFIYLKNKFYSFGLGVGGKSSTIFPIDWIPYFCDRSLSPSFYSDIVKFRDECNAKYVEIDNRLKNEYLLHPQRVQLTAELNNIGIIMRNYGTILTKMPLIGNKIIDIGILSQFHLNNINTIIKSISNITMDFCAIKKQDLYNGDETYTINFLHQPMISLSSEYNLFCFKFGTTGSIMPTTKKQSRPSGKVPSGMNCTSGLEWIFSDSIKCDGGTILPVETTGIDKIAINILKNTIGNTITVPGNCRRINNLDIDKKTGLMNYEENPITHDEMVRIFLDLMENKERKREKQQKMADFIKHNKLNKESLLMHTHKIAGGDSKIRKTKKRLNIKRHTRRK
jgi:hypothetical protein